MLLERSGGQGRTGTWFPEGPQGSGLWTWACSGQRGSLHRSPTTEEGRIWLGFMGVEILEEGCDTHALPPQLRHSPRVPRASSLLPALPLSALELQPPLVSSQRWRCSQRMQEMAAITNHPSKIL